MTVENGIFTAEFWQNFCLEYMQAWPRVVDQKLYNCIKIIKLYVLIFNS